MIILTVTACIILVCFWFSKQFEKHGAKKVTCDIQTDKIRINEYENLNYRVEIRNIKLLILPIINIIVSIPLNFSYMVNNQDVSKGRENESIKTIKITTSLLSYQKVIKKFMLSASTRGYYEVHTSISAQDLLGLKTVHLKTSDIKKVLVHPTPKLPFFITSEANSIQGDQLVKRWSNPDPIFYSGIREYTPRDSFKDIDWKASARVNTLLVKKYDTTSDFTFDYLLLINRSNRYEIDFNPFLEEVLSTIAYFCKQNEKDEIPYAYNTNLGLRNTTTFYDLPRLGGNHLLETFDRMSYTTTTPDYSPSSYMEDMVENISKNSIVVLFFYELDEACVSIIQSLKNMGYNVKVIIHKVNLYTSLVKEEILLLGGDMHE